MDGIERKVGCLVCRRELIDWLVGWLKMNTILSFFRTFFLVPRLVLLCLVSLAFSLSTTTSAAAFGETETILPVRLNEVVLGQLFPSCGCLPVSFSYRFRYQQR